MDDGYHNELNTDSGAYKRNFDIICGPNKNSNSYGYSSALSLSVKRFWHNEGYYSQMFVEFNDPYKRGSTLYSFGYNGHGQLGHNDVINPHGYGHTQTAPKAVGSLMRGTWKAGTFDNPIYGSDPSTDYAQSANMSGPDNWIKIREVILTPGPNHGGVGHQQLTCIITEDGRVFVCGYQHSIGTGHRRRSLHGASYFLEANPAQGTGTCSRGPIPIVRGNAHGTGKFHIRQRVWTHQRKARRLRRRSLWGRWTQCRRPLASRKNSISGALVQRPRFARGRTGFVPISHGESVARSPAGSEADAEPRPRASTSAIVENPSGACPRTADHHNRRTPDKSRPRGTTGHGRQLGGRNLRSRGCKGNFRRGFG